VEIETGQDSLSISINREERPSKDIVISYPLPKDENIGVKCGVALFGETVFTLIPEEKELQVLEILEKYDNNIILQTEIDNVGARLQ